MLHGHKDFAFFIHWLYNQPPEQASPNGYNSLIIVVVVIFIIGI